MCFVISNVKLSAKIPEKSLDVIKIKCEENEIDFSVYKNFIVFRLLGFTYILFKKKSLKNCEKNNEVKQHVNITTKSLEKIPDAIENLKRILDYKTDVNIEFQIDNLTATASLDKKVNFDAFLENNKDITEKISFNPEKFPSIFISHQNRKILLFRSGVFNILGGKSLEEINETYSWICAKSVRQI